MNEQRRILNREVEKVKKGKRKGDFDTKTLFDFFDFAVKISFSVFLVFVFASCELYTYGILGGADKTACLTPGSPDFERVMSSMSGVWYSHYAGAGRLDGYRIGEWSSFNAIAGSKTAALFPGFTYPQPVYAGSDSLPAPSGGDYFVLHDDTAHGQTDDSAPGQESRGFAYAGIVRAINIFNGDKKRGAIIIQYLNLAAPQWDDDIKGGQRPFFGIYYRILDPDCIQMANAVDLASMYKGKKYYTETATRDEAIAFNTVENEAEFISWGVVIPQDREK
jgi:hypothetical protein